MNKKTKIVLGVALLGGVGYYMWMKSKSAKTASFANAAGVQVTANCSGGGQCVVAGSRKAMNDPKICNSDGTCKNGLK